MYLGHFWNTYCEKRNDIIIVLCGSAASYMVQNVISNKGSLRIYNSKTELVAKQNRKKKLNPT